MKKKKRSRVGSMILVVLCLTLFLSANVSAQTLKTFSASGEVVHIQTSLLVRKSPSRSGKILGSLKNGATVSITGETGDWYQIHYGSGKAYVSKTYISRQAQDNARKGVVQVRTTLLVRAEPSLSGKVVGYFQNGKQVSILGSSNGYYRIRYGSGTAYVSMKYVSEGSGSQNSQASSTGTISSVSKVGYANVTTSLLVRTKPSSQASVMGRLHGGERMTIIGETDNWYQIRYSGRKGYVNKAYVSFTEPTAGSQEGYRKVSLNVPLYRQYDNRWASVKIGNQTLRSAGCVTTGLAMMRQYRTGNTCTPAQMAKTLKYTSGGSVYWPSSTTQYTGSNYLRVIYQQLSAGNPVLIGARSSNGNQHYVVVTGYNGSSSKLTASGFQVNDPGRSNAANLQSFFNRTPQFYKLVYFI